MVPSSAPSLSVSSFGFCPPCVLTPPLVAAHSYATELGALLDDEVQQVAAMWMGRPRVGVHTFSSLEEHMGIPRQNVQ
eukprot:6517330-Pyramimonas_sp.AAC.1